MAMQSTPDEQWFYDMMARNERIAKARASWPHGPEDFDAMMVEHQEEEERRQFFRDHPTPEARIRAIAAMNRAIAQGVD